MLRPFRVDDVDFVAYVYAVGDGLLVGVFTDHVLPEESIGPVVRRSGQADEIGIKILEDLSPKVVNRAMAFVDDDEVEELGRDFLAIGDLHRILGLHDFRWINLLGSFVQLLALQDRVHPLDGADADLAVVGDVRRFKALDIVKLGKLAVVVRRHVGHKLLFGLFTEVLGVYKEEDSFGVCVFEQPVNRGNGRVGFAGPCSHLNEGTWLVFFEGLLEVHNGVDLARPEPLGIQFRQSLETLTQWTRLTEPVRHGLRPVKAEHLS